MRCLLTLLTLNSIVHGIELTNNGFRAKYGNGTSEAEADNKDYFFKLPLNADEAKEYGYNQVVNYSSPKNYIMLCAPGRIVCPLFLNTAKGMVVGLRVNIPVAAISSDLNPAQYFGLWNAPASKDEPAQGFWYSTQYFKHGSLLGTDVTGLDGKNLKIPANESDFISTTFKKQNCVPNMGTHYYYNMTRDLTCVKPLLPWFALVDKGKLVGVGFQTFGNKSEVKVGSNQTDWLEDIPRYPRTTPRRAIPDAPECFLDKSSKYGRLSIHVYYIEKPWELKCEPKDSVNPILAENPDAVIESDQTHGLENLPKEDSKSGSKAKSHAIPIKLNMVVFVMSLVLMASRD